MINDDNRQTPTNSYKGGLKMIVSMPINFFKGSRLFEISAIGKKRAAFVTIFMSALFYFTGCTAVGPRHVPQDRFKYNEALAESTRHQMLLNLVRIRYLEEPVFLSVSSILTQYVYNVGASAGGQFLLDEVTDNTSNVSAGANLGYEERPTITYIPIEGREFSVRMLSAIPSETMFAAAQQGWSVDSLMRIGINRIGAVENMGFEAIPAPGHIDLSKQLKREVDKLKKFQRVIQLLIVLADEEVFEMRIVEEKGAKTAFLLFAKSVPEDIQSQVVEFKQVLGLSPKINMFRITDRVTDLKEDEISIQTRSLSAMMNFLAKGVQVPPEHLADGRVIDYEIPTAERGGKDLIPFRMISSQTQPKSAFAAVRYQGYWFYIDNKDIESKRSLGLIIALFRVLAPSGGGAAPILTLPTG
jgi:hypothetical protein